MGTAAPTRLLLPSRLLLIVAFGLAVVGSLSACRDDADDVAVPARTPVAPPPAPSPLTLDGTTDVAFRYLDPATGRPATATTVDAIPEAARAQVIVLPLAGEAPPGWEHVADLTRPLPVTTVPTRGFVLSPPSPAEAAPDPAPPARRRVGPPEVVMFSGPGCKPCKHARKWLSERRVPFTELDLGTDPKAWARLDELAARAGLRERDKSGVPIFFVDGQPVLGFDRARLAKLIGL